MILDWLLLSIPVLLLHLVYGPAKNRGAGILVIFPCFSDGTRMNGSAPRAFHRRKEKELVQRWFDLGRLEASVVAGVG